MGNRAVITTKQGWISKENNLGLYLHWNGGRGSVEAFLAYCKAHGYRSPESDCYGWAALAAVITNFFGADGLSVGLDIVSRLDCNNDDNGVYIVENWEIVGRYYAPTQEQQTREQLGDRLQAIDDAMPERARLGADKIAAYIEQREAPAF